MPARPLFWLTIFFMLGIAAYRLVGASLPVQPHCFAIAALILTSAMALTLWFRVRTAQFVIPALLFAVFGIWAAKSAAPQIQQDLEPFLNGQSVSYTAEVSGGTEYFPERTRTSLRLLWAIKGDREIALNSGVLLGLPRKNPTNPSLFLEPGDRVLFRGVLKRFRSYKNPGGFDYVLYQAERGLNAQCFLKDERFVIKLSPPPGTSPVSILNALRGRIELFRQKTLIWAQKSLDPAPAAFYAAMILGYKTLLDRNWQDHVHQTGLNHLLSVSGLHIGMVSMFVFSLVRLAVRSLRPSILNRMSDKQIALWPALATAVLYAFLAGFGAPTIWRSILTLAVFFGAAFWYRRADSLTVLALAALLILILDPDNLWQIPFQLTFGCVLAIIVIYPGFRKIRLHRIFPALEPNRTLGRIISQFEDAFWVSIAVNILLLPLIIFYFDGFALAGVAANILLIPYTGFVILPLGLFSVLIFALSETLAYPVLFVLNYLLWGALRFIEWFTGFTWSYFWTGSMSPAWLFVIYAALGLFFVPFSRKLKIAGLSALAALACVGLVLSHHAASNTGALTVDVIDVGQGSSALVRLPSGETMLVDGGGIPDDSYDVGRGVLAPFLWHEGIRRLDYVVVSHDHPDHGLGLRFILAHFDVGSFWTSGIIEKNTKASLCGLDEIALKRKIKIRSFPDLFSDVQIGRVRIRLLHPTPDFLAHGSKKDLNDDSLVLEISWGETRVILPGDIGRNIELSIIPALEGSMQTLLVAAHHGSHNSNSEEFLDALRPRAIAFSCGYDNQFGFPAPAAIERCVERNIPIYRTDLQGAVHAVSDGLKWTITTESDRNINAQKNRER
ncbi:MAG: DNA internalization-related competence protein ComEC/Rec2 [Syntrophobacteraceae bacterium]|jgi:competence protein ComEC